MGSWSVTSNPIVYGKQGRFINNSLQSRWPPLSFECQQKLTLPHTARKQKSFRSRKRKVKCLFLFDNECRRFWNWSKNKTKKGGRRENDTMFTVSQRSGDWRGHAPTSLTFSYTLHPPSATLYWRRRIAGGHKCVRVVDSFFFFSLSFVPHWNTRTANGGGGAG